MRRRSPRLSSVAVGLIALVAITVLTYFGFAKDIPFTRGFEIRAEFANAVAIRPGAPVRIAGVDVGKVARVEPKPGSDAAVVVLAVEEEGRPLHLDATAKIRPRIFLEGNFFVDLEPGSPGRAELSDGDALTVTQTASPVQLDEVLTSLQSDAREDLKDVLDGIGTAWSSNPSAAEDRDADPSARGQTAAESFNDAYDSIPEAERSISRVNQALLGVEPDADLQRLLRGGARTAAGLARNEEQLQDLVTNFNRTTAALAAESGALSASIRLLAPTLASANRAFDTLNAAFPPTRAFALEILPGVRETAATIDAAFPWIEQTRRLVAPDELQGLARRLSPAVRDLARTIDTSYVLLPEINRTARCASDVLLPTGDIVVRDEFETGVENYKEFFYGLVGLAGEGQNFDGNGQYVRFQTGGGANTIQLGGEAPQFGNLVGTPLGARPGKPRRKPPYRPDAPCYRQQRPDVNGPAGARISGDRARSSAATKARQKRELEDLRAKLRPFGSRSGGEGETP